MRTNHCLILTLVIFAGPERGAARQVNPAAAHSARTQGKIMPMPGKIRAAKVVGAIHHKTGRLVWFDGNTNARTPRGNRMVAFDNLSAPPQDPNLGLNICALSERDPNTGAVDLLCRYPVASDMVYMGSAGVGDQDCPFADQGPYYTGLINDPQDILFDKYLMDPSAGEPNDPVDVRHVTALTFYNGQDVGVMGLNVFFAEATDIDGSGQYDTLDGVTVFTLWDANTPSSLYTISLDMDAAFGPDEPLDALVRGRRSYDVLNEVFEPSDPTMTTTIGPACSWRLPFTGGNPQGLFNWDPNCAIPQDLVNVGTVDEPNLLMAWGRTSGDVVLGTERWPGSRGSGSMKPAVGSGTLKAICR